MLIITPDGGYIHIPHDLLLSTPAVYLSAQYGLTPEWITFAQQLAQGDVAQVASQSARPSKPTPRPFKRKRSPWAPPARDHRKQKPTGGRDHRKR